MIINKGPPGFDDNFGPRGTNIVNLTDGEAALCELLHRGQETDSTLTNLAEREAERRKQAAAVQTVAEIKAFTDFLTSQPFDPRILERMQTFEGTFAGRVEEILSNCCLVATPAMRVETAKKVAQAAGVLGERWLPCIEALRRGDAAEQRFPPSPQRLNWGTLRTEEPWREYGRKLVALKRALQSATNDPVAVCFCAPADGGHSAGGLRPEGSVTFAVYVDGAPANRGIVWERDRLLGSVQEKLSGVLPGPHEYLIRLDGFQDAVVPVDVASTNTVQARVELHPVPPITLVRTEPSVCTLLIKASETEQATEYRTDEHGWLTLRLQEGTYTLEITREDYLPQELRHVVRRGQDSTIAVALSLQPGRLVVNATASGDGTALPASVLNGQGQVLGNAGQTIDKIPAGTNVFQIALSEYRTETITLFIPPNHEVVTNVSLVKLGGPDPLKEFVKELQGCLKWGMDTRDYDKCRSDVEGICDCIMASLHNTRYVDLIAKPEVLGAQEGIWEAVAGTTVNAFLEPSPKERDWRYLALARGALSACMRTGATTNAFQVLAGWTERKPEIGENLPLPRVVAVPMPTLESTESFLTGLPSDVRARSVALSVLPAALAVQILANIEADSQSNATRFLLVPDGLAPKDSRLRVEQPFYMMETEVTAELMRRCREDVSQALVREPRLNEYLAPLTNITPSATCTAPYATIQVDEAVSFCNWLSHRAGLPMVYRRNPNNGGWLADLRRPSFRLPTEDEWEYAARAGFDWLAPPGALSWTKMEQSLADVLQDATLRERNDLLVFFGNKDKPRDTSQPLTNRYPLGFRDLCGNVAEICMCVATEGGASREVEFFARGGSYKSCSPVQVLPTARSAKPVSRQSDRLDLGFRVVLPMPIEVSRTNPIGGST